MTLYRYCINHKINIIHAHSSSFFMAWIIKMMMPKLKLVWHDHYGNSEFLNNRPKKVIKFCSKRFSQIFSVNKALQAWAQRELLCKKVDYLQNFPVLASVSTNLTDLHGEDGKRIVCLANLRQQKNHMRLLEAFRIVSKDYPNWTLHCVGKDFNDDYSKRFLGELKDPEFKDVVFFYDSKIDILNILQQCAIGILVSKSEGLPLALLEYGLAGLAVISTDVGECKSVLPNSDLGILLENDDASTIANAIVNYIENQKYREKCGVEFMARVDEFYSKDAILKEVVAIYKSL